jgi:hypothetical protein
MNAPRIADLLDRALTAQTHLEERGMAVEDEWQYVTDLVGAWRARFEAVRAVRADEPVSAEVAAAVDAVAVSVRRRGPPPGHRLAVDHAAGRAAALGEST